MKQQNNLMEKKLKHQLIQVQLRDAIRKQDPMETSACIKIAVEKYGYKSEAQVMRQLYGARPAPQKACGHAKGSHIT